MERAANRHHANAPQSARIQRRIKTVRYERIERQVNLLPLRLGLKMSAVGLP